jgi:CDP-paratose 2-epimerase
MTVLVTGGAGFIGANLAHRLLSLGEHVRILDNLSRAGVDRNVDWLLDNHANKFELVVGDVRDAAVVDQAIEGVHHVFHLAAQVAVTTSLVDPHVDFAVNGLGALNVLESVRRSRRAPTLIYTSTNKVYGALEDVALTTARTRYDVIDPEIAASGISEKRPLEFHSPYGCSKGTADQYVLDYARSFGVRAAVFRMSCIYGPRQFGTEDQGWVAHFLIRALHDEPITIYGDGRQVRDLLFIDDLVDAFLRARENIDGIAGRAFNVGGGPTRTISLLELCARIETLTHRPLRLDFQSWRLADQRYYVSDPRALGEATGWTPRTSVHDGVQWLYDWLSRQPEHRISDSTLIEVSP